MRIVRHYSSKGYGERKLREELYRRGVSRALWDEALGQAQSSEEAICAFSEKKLAGKKPDAKDLKQVSDALARRGYSWSEISSVLDQYRAEWD